MNTEHFPCSGSHRLHTIRFLRTFEHFDFKFVELTNHIDLAKLELNPADIFYFSNHGISDELTSHQLEFLHRLSQSRVHGIFWYWLDKRELLDSLFQARWVLTGEKLLSKHVLASHEKASVQLASEVGLPLQFGATIAPDEIEKVRRLDVWDVGYIGARYHPFINSIIKMQIPKVKIHYTPPFVEENYRISIYTNSKIVLGWHSSNNIQNGVIGERVFEALAYGAAVVTDNPYALEATDGNVFFASDAPSALEIIRRLQADKLLLDRTKLSGISWAKSFGTYHHVVPKFIERLK